MFIGETLLNIVITRVAYVLLCQQWGNRSALLRLEWTDAFIPILSGVGELRVLCCACRAANDPFSLRMGPNILCVAYIRPRQPESIVEAHRADNPLGMTSLSRRIFAFP
jgi:hypothetical protein